jgi:septal ring factor EnvC (AmiA/AmiB activator)
MKSPDNRKKSKSPLPKKKNSSRKKRSDESVEFSIDLSKMSLDDQTVGTTKSELRRQRDFYGQAYEEKKAQMDAVEDFFQQYDNETKRENAEEKARADHWQEAYLNEKAERERAERRAAKAERERNQTRGRDDASRSRSRDRVPDDDSHLGSVDGTGDDGGLNGLD